MSRIDEILFEIEHTYYPGSGLQRIKPCLEALQHPEKKLSCIHVAGTNGKGSTVHYIQMILQQANYKVGTFTSPYTLSYFDRIRVQNQFIDEEDFIRIYLQTKSYLHQFQLSKFEIETVIAILYFVEKKCDICIFECGLGGLHDATNVIHPCCCVITNIGYDHMDILGNSLEEITLQKAGIIKEGIPCITTIQQPHCLNVLKTVCKKHNSSCIIPKPVTNVQILADKILFYYQDIKLHLSTLATYQIENARCAIACCQQLQNIGYQILETDIVMGIQQAHWHGRFEIMHQDPLLVIDGAHNVDGILALKKALKPFSNYQIIFSALKDKEYEKMLTLLFEDCKQITITTFAFQRSASIEDLKKAFPVSIVPDYKDAIKQALQTSDVPIIVCGSLYFISQVRNYLINDLHMDQKTL